MEITTKKEFDQLTEANKVLVKYDSRYIIGFEQTFSQSRYPGVVKVSPEEWSNLWDTYHDYDVRKVSFELVTDNT